MLLGKDNASATWTLSPAILQTKAKKGFLEHKADQVIPYLKLLLLLSI